MVRHCATANLDVLRLDEVAYARALPNSAVLPDVAQWPDLRTLLNRRLSAD